MTTEKVEVILCPDCEGMGGLMSISGEIVPCALCEGFGRLMQYTNTTTTPYVIHNDGVQFAICDSCMGKGKKDIVICEECNGSGFVKEEIVEEYSTMIIDDIDIDDEDGDEESEEI